jgi:ribosomal protein L44E
MIHPHRVVHSETYYLPLVAESVRYKVKIEPSTKFENVPEKRIKIVHPPPPRIIKCPICSISITSDILKRHLANRHKPAQLAKYYNEIRLVFDSLKLPLPAIQTKVVKKEMELFKCDKCSAMLAKNRLKRHMKKVHNTPSKKTASNSSAVIVVHKTLNPNIQCPQCSLMVLKSKLSKHLKSQHKVISANPVNKQRSVTPNKPKITDVPSSRYPDQIEGVSKMLDATYGTHTIRDGGRFGSYPSHDNFDDESAA